MYNTNTTDEEEETLSLCDLPLYSDQSDIWGEDLSRESQGSSSISSSEDDYFEFFSQELDPFTTSDFPRENIIFCGKLIPYKQPSIPEKSFSRLIIGSKNQTNNEGLCRLKFGSRESSKRHVVHSKKSQKSTTHVHKKDHHVSREEMYNTKKHGKGYNRPVHKMSTLTPSSSGKVRWYFLFFGPSRLSMEVEWSDIKRRQSQRRSTPPPSPPVLRIKSGGDENFNKRTNKVWGLWGLITALSCGGHRQATAMVAESIAPAPLT